MKSIVDLIGEGTDTLTKRVTLKPTLHPLINNFVHCTGISNSQVEYFHERSDREPEVR